MLNVPVLSLPDFNDVFILETDSLGTGIGVVLSQKNRPIAFYSQALRERLGRRSVYER